MSFSSNYDVQIAGRTSMRPRIALARNTNTLAIASARLDANFERLGASDHAFPMTDRARRHILAATMAARASHIELHPVGALLDCALTFALRTHARLLNHAIAVAIRAHVLARDIQAHDSAANRRPERNIDLIFEIAARLRTFLRDRAAAPAAEHAGEDVAKSTATS